jgi:hypothetical protein
MPGTFAHITLAGSLCGSDQLDRVAELPNYIKAALGSYSKFCELGAVSPDYPYLALSDNEAKGWANVMHYWQTADFLRRGVRHLSTAGDLQSPSAQKCIAWLFGFASHVVADLTVHPVIELIVGPYVGNERRHRVCEMHQDVHIFQKRLNLEIASAEYLRASGIRDCGEILGNTHHLSTPIKRLWTDILNEIALDQVILPGQVPKPGTAPQPDRWHHHYITKIDGYAEEGRWLFLARGFLEWGGLVYPPSDKVQPEFISNLKLPGGGTANYEEVFDRAAENVIEMWRQLGAAFTESNSDLVTLANANLDTGRADGAQPGAAPLFWPT